ncbi:hypothetical protein F511_26369 [Dorcoceras hygrometricum]|uniref:Uncharacterized protein n=1 Tax=Dorcoceras hygrometricum TaxID=472368 RepID=A0A2Z7CMF9_9LAMI|nr:hypothetical protein F511_26369 [Dorcoceras hygrometricum]
MEEILERRPTLPRTSKTTTGNDGNSLKKLTAEQCSRVRRIRNKRLEISKLLPESSGFLAGLVVAQYKETQVIQLVVVLAQLVVPFDASGNPGSTAGCGFNPAGGAPGGG